jgi:hypothetical protein
VFDDTVASLPPVPLVAEVVIHPLSPMAHSAIKTIVILFIIAFSLPYFYTLPQERLIPYW